MEIVDIHHSPVFRIWWLPIPHVAGARRLSPLCRAQWLPHPAPTQLAHKLVLTYIYFSMLNRKIFVTLINRICEIVPDHLSFLLGFWISIWGTLGSELLWTLHSPTCVKPFHFLRACRSFSPLPDAGDHHLQAGPNQPGEVVLSQGLKLKCSPRD